MGQQPCVLHQLSLRIEHDIKEAAKGLRDDFHLPRRGVTLIEDARHDLLQPFAIVIKTDRQSRHDDGFQSWQ